MLGAPARKRARGNHPRGQVMQQDQLDELLETGLRELDVPGGGQVAVLADGRVAASAAGVANANGGIPVVDETLFQIGSTTKVFNAVAFMQLVERGDVDLDTPVAAYLDVAIGPSSSQHAITPRQLLSMSSGIDNGPYHDTGRNDDCVARYLECLADIPMVHEPGQGYGYSNASSDIAGRIIEVQRAAPWEEALTDCVLRPLGLTQTDALLDRVIRHPVAVGHHGSREEAKPLPLWALCRGHAPAGATLCSSASGLVDFARFFLEGSDGVLSRETIDLMHVKLLDTPTRFMAHGWCLGPYYKVWDGVEIYGHSGTNLGGSSTLLWIPEHRVAAAVVTNAPPKGYPLAEYCFREILASYCGIDLPVRAESSTSNVGDLSDHVGLYRAHHVEIEITEVDKTTLHARKVSRQFEGTEHVLESDLRPLEAGRFLVGDPTFSGGRDWDIAFWGDHLTDGVFTFKKATA